MTQPTILSKADDLLLRSAYAGANADARAALDDGADVNAVDPATGLAALHLAIGTNNEPLTRTLVDEFSAAFLPMHEVVGRVLLQRHLAWTRRSAPMSFRLNRASLV